MRAGAHELLVGGQAGVAQRGAVAREALGGGVERRRVADVGDPLVAVSDEVRDRGAGAADVVEQDGVGVDAARRAIEEDDRDAVVELGLQVAVVVAGGDDEQRVDRAPQQPQDQLALALGVLLARAGDEDVAAGVRGVLDRPRDGRVERVGDVLDHEPERVGAPVAQRARDVVACEAELRDGRLDARRRRRPHAVLAVDDARDRLQADARAARDVAHRGPAPRSPHSSSSTR